MYRRIKAKYIERGLLGILVPAVRRLPGIRALCVYYVYRFPFSSLPKEYVPPERVRAVVLESVEDLEKILPVLNKEEIFRERFEMKHFCALTYVNDEAVSYLWAQRESMHIEKRYGFEISIAENQVFYYDSYTKPEWRKKGLSRFLIREMALYCKNRLNRDELVTIIEVDNKTSQNAYEKVGFLKQEVKMFLDMMGQRLHFKLS